MEEGGAEAASSSGQQEEEEEEEEEEEDQSNEISEYEQQRLSRIRENKARLEALGLPNLASSLLLASSPKQRQGRAKNKGKKKEEEDDDEYRPSDEDDHRGENDDGGSFSASGKEEEEEDSGPSSSSRRKGKKKSSSNTTRVKKSLFMKRHREDFDQIDEDAALQQAIALSLGRTAEDSAVASDVVSPSSDRVETGISVKKDKATQETAGKRKTRKMNKSRVQLTADEVVAYFFSFDEAGKGHISLRDLQRIALAHDFSWTESEIASMIHSFDSDRDGKLSLEDFQTVVSRCNMMQETGNS